MEMEKIRMRQSGHLVSGKMRIQDRSGDIRILSYRLTHPLVLGTALVVLVLVVVVPRAGISVAPTPALPDPTSTAKGRVAPDSDDAGRLRLELDRGRPRWLAIGAARGRGWSCS